MTLYDASRSPSTSSSPPHRVTAVALDAAGASATSLPAPSGGRPLVLVGAEGSALSRALDDAGLSAVAVEDDDVAVATQLAVRQLGELRALRDDSASRASIERAKGVLMARHGIGEREAFELLRRHARNTQQKLTDVVAAVLASHPLLAEQTDGSGH